MIGYPKKKWIRFLAWNKKCSMSARWGFLAGHSWDTRWTLEVVGRSGHLLAVCARVRVCVCVVVVVCLVLLLSLLLLFVRWLLVVVGVVVDVCARVCVCV